VQRNQTDHHNATEFVVVLTHAIHNTRISHLYRSSSTCSWFSSTSECLGHGCYSNRFEQTKLLLFNTTCNNVRHSELKKDKQQTMPPRNLYSQWMAQWKNIRRVNNNCYDINKLLHRAPNKLKILDLFRGTGWCVALEPVRPSLRQVWPDRSICFIRPFVQLCMCCRSGCTRPLGGRHPGSTVSSMTAHVTLHSVSTYV